MYDRRVFLSEKCIVVNLIHKCGKEEKVGKFLLQRRKRYTIMFSFESKRFRCHDLCDSLLVSESVA